jgi:chitin synthase
MVIQVQAAAYDYFFPPISAHGADVHRRVERPLSTNQFATVHDVSCGTKGDNKVNTDLGVVSAGKDENKNQVEVALPTTETDINVAYENAIYVLSSKTPKTESKPDPATEQEDYYKMFRMDVLLVWTLSNVSDHLFGSYRAIV